MEILVYFAFGIFVLVVMWWIVKVSTGMLLPPEKTGRAYLLQLLRRMQVDQVVPTALIDECVAESLKLASFTAKMHGGSNNKLREELVNQVEFYADALRLWIRSSDSFADASYKSRLKEMFERHGVPRLGQRAK